MLWRFARALRLATAVAAPCAALDRTAYLQAEPPNRAVQYPSSSAPVQIMHLFSSAQGPSSALTNAVVLIPGVLDPTECQLLVDEANMLVKQGCGASHHSGSLWRLSVCDMSEAAQRISTKIFTERVLPVFRRQLPERFRDLFSGQMKMEEELPSTCDSFVFSGSEPTVNCYKAGGHFTPHEDGLTLTVIIVLSAEGAFKGGGTAFWPEATDNEAHWPSFIDSTTGRVVVHPPQGAALLFNGHITHAGETLASGIRHLYVASFHIVDIDDDDTDDDDTSC